MITDNELIELEQLVLMEEQEKAKDNFYDYCKYREPDFYNKDRMHLKKLCNILNDFYHDDLLKDDGTAYSKIMINMPPQHGKSRTLVNFTQWCLGKNRKERIISASYNDTQAGEIARFTRDGIQEEKSISDQHVFSDIFPDCKIKQGNASYQKWALEGQHFNYLGVGVGGGVTGKGATIRIVDDLVKDAETALNNNALEKIWIWYSGTYSSRNAAEGGKVKEIFCATPWSDNDPQGKLKKYEPKEWYIFSMPVYDEETDTMLCPKIMSKEEYLKLKARMLRSPATSMIFWANYHNKNVNMEGRLYKSFKTYKELPKENGQYLFNKINSYTDTADTGEDYLCSIIYGVYNNAAYILDIYYTQEAMEITEAKTARKHYKYNVSKAYIESNNGGRGFARNVEKELKNKYNTRKTIIKWFHQSNNKETRIHVNSARVQENIYYPIDWANRYPEYYESMTTYQARGKNSHDDAQDATTGVIEYLEKNDKWGW